VDYGTPVGGSRVARARPIVIQPSGGLRPGYVRELWDARETLWILVWRDIKLRYKQTLLGAAWAILQPLLTMLVFAVFLGLLAKVPSGHRPYALVVLAALVPWSFFTYALNQGSISLVEKEELVTKVYFPRIIIPLASVLAGIVDFVLAFATLLVVMAVYGTVPTWWVLLLPVLVLFELVAALGTAMWLSALCVTYRDIRYTVVFLSQLLFYLSPIAYLSTIVPAQFRALYGANPVAGVVEAFRAMMLGLGPSWPLIGTSIGAAVVLFVTGWMYFRRTERGFADVI
jgi:lipopolysaccharide transport system permease protein